MGIAKSISSIVLGTLAVAVTLAALTCYQSALNRGSLASSANVGLSQLLALDYPEAPKATAADIAAIRSEELKDWTYTARHGFSRSPGDYQSGSLAGLMRQVFSFFSSSQFYGNQFSGASFVSSAGSHRGAVYGGMPGLGVFHRSHHSSHYISSMQGLPSAGSGSPFTYGSSNFAGSQPYGSWGSWASPNYSSPSPQVPYPSTGTPSYVSNTPPAYTPPAYSPPAYTAPVSSNSSMSSFVQQATNFASSSSFVSVRVRAFELVSQTFERIVTNIGGVSSSIERTTVVSTIQVEVQIRRFRSPANASPYA